MESKGNRNDWCRPFHLRTEFNSLHAHTHFSWNSIQCRRYTKCKAQQYTMSEVTTTCARIEKAKWHKMKKKIQLKMFENEYKPDWERGTHSHTRKQQTVNEKLILLQLNLCSFCSDNRSKRPEWKTRRKFQHQARIEP